MKNTNMVLVVVLACVPLATYAQTITAETIVAEIRDCRRQSASRPYPGCLNTLDERIQEFVAAELASGKSVIDIASDTSVFACEGWPHNASSAKLRRLIDRPEGQELKLVYRDVACGTHGHLYVLANSWRKLGWYSLYTVLVKDGTAKIQELEDVEDIGEWAVPMTYFLDFGDGAVPGIHCAVGPYLPISLWTSKYLTFNTTTEEFEVEVPYYWDANTRGVSQFWYDEDSGTVTLEHFDKNQTSGEWEFTYQCITIPNLERVEPCVPPEGASE
jgi:hypothetical protein